MFNYMTWKSKQIIMDRSDYDSVKSALTGKKAILDADGDAAPYNGYSANTSYDTSVAGRTGFVFSKLDDWIYGLIDSYI